MRSKPRVILQRLAAVATKKIIYIIVSLEGIDIVNVVHLNTLIYTLTIHGGQQNNNHNYNNQKKKTSLTNVHCVRSKTSLYKLSISQYTVALHIGHSGIKTSALTV